MWLAPVRPTPRLSMDNLRRLLRGLSPPSQWAAWENPMKSPRLRFFWRRMTRVSSRVSNCSLMAAEGKSKSVDECVDLSRWVVEGDQSDSAGPGPPEINSEESLRRKIAGFLPANDVLTK